MHVTVDNVRLDLEKMMGQKSTAVKGLTGGIAHLFTVQLFRAGDQHNGGNLTRKVSAEAFRRGVSHAVTRQTACGSQRSPRA